MLKAVVFEILKGFATTFRQLFNRPVTIQYPDIKRPVRPRFRGLHELRRYADGLERCIGCALCAAACPADAIYVEAGEIHASLIPELRKQLNREWRIQPLFLMEPVVRPLTGRKRILGPGDLLTLLYMTRPKCEGECA